jgi:hypothetical protein
VLHGSAQVEDLCHKFRRKREINMERPEFDITITKAGKLKVHIKGVKGTRCTEMADLIKQIVGKEDERHLTSEYYEQAGQVRINTQVRDHTK